MASSVVIDGDLHVMGRLSMATVALPAESVGDDQVNASSAISASKIASKTRLVLSQNSTTNAAADSKVVYVAKAAGTIKSFDVGAVTKAVGDSTATFDLKKNGTTVLTGTVTITSAGGFSNYVPTAGTLDGSQVALVANDVLEVVLTISAGTGTLPKGVYAQVIVEEDPI